MADYALHPLLHTAGSEYTTPPTHEKSWVLTPSLYFFIRLAGVVYRDGRRAKRRSYTGEDWIRASINILQYLEDAGISVQIEGLHNIARESGPVVFVSNHMSTLETLILPGVIHPRKSTTFVVKESLMEYPYFQHILRSRDPIVVGRTNPREDLVTVLQGGAARLRQGISIILFPQTTRREVFDPDAFNTLGVKLAARNSVSVVPLALVTDAWPNGKIFKDVAKLRTENTVHFAFGAPLNARGKGAEAHSRVVEFIRSKLLEWNREDCLAGERIPSRR